MPSSGSRRRRGACSFMRNMKTLLQVGHDPAKSRSKLGSGSVARDDTRFGGSDLDAAGEVLSLQKAEAKAC